MKCVDCERLWPLRFAVPSLHRCVNCAREWWREDRKLRRGTRWKSYGLSEKDLQAQLAKQGGACPICSRKISFGPSPGTKQAQVDHCHETQALRGLLCGPCNRGLGMFGDSAAILHKAVDYLERRGTVRLEPNPSRGRTGWTTLKHRIKKGGTFVTARGEVIDAADTQRMTDPRISEEVTGYIVAQVESNSRRGAIPAVTVPATEALPSGRPRRPRSR